MTTKPFNTTMERPQARSGYKLAWKARLIGAGIAIVLIVLDTQWKTIDKYFPKLNKVLHAGSVSSAGDVSYLMGHLQQDVQTLSDPCTDYMTFQQCRAAMISNKPALEDFNLSVGKLDEAWSGEVRERNVPQACQDEMNGILGAYKDFVKTENDKLGLLEAMDSEEASKQLMAQYNGADMKDIAAWQAFRRLKKTGACQGY